MRVPLTSHGTREIVAATLLCGGLAALAAIWSWWLAFVPLLLWIGVVSFFRDPDRSSDEGPEAWLAPADGKVTEVTSIEHDPVIGGPAIRVGIFLSIFDVHINRSPTECVVRSVTHRPGRFLNAMSAESSAENESTTLVIEPIDRSVEVAVVRQVAGLIARRIVCRVRPGDRLALGERFGMIKFGSRTELIVPRTADFDVVARVGDKVRAGRTVIARLTPSARPESHRPQERVASGVS